MTVSYPAEAGKTINEVMLDGGCYIMSVSVLLEQPCNKSDSPIKRVTRC